MSESKWVLTIKHIDGSIEEKRVFDDRPSIDQITKTTQDYLASISIARGMIAYIGSFMYYLEEVRSV
jgi:hypothetical protein